MKKWMTTLLLALSVCMLYGSALAGAPEIEFDAASGFYNEPFTLTIRCSDKKATVYYTLDGTAPDRNSAVYESGLLLNNSAECETRLSLISGIKDQDSYVPEDVFPRAHVVRAVAINAKGEASEVISGTFFVGYDRQALYGDTSIMLLVMEPDDLFDYETGIYVLGKYFDEWVAQQTDTYQTWQIVANYSQRGRDWERPVSVTYLPAEGEGFVQAMGVRIKGNVSRAHAQKSLRLIARDDYGKKNVKYELYPDNVREEDGQIVDRYKSFTLRNGGSDCSYAKFRDHLITELSEGLRMATAENMPCIAFINGEYWGLYTLNEEYSDNYFQYHYGIDNDNIITVKVGKIEDGEEEDISLFHELHDFVVDNDMSDAANYARCAEMMDIDSFIDFWAMQLYINNEDGPVNNNNWQMWRVREPGQDKSPFADGKWRMILFDTDYSSGVYNKGDNGAADNVTKALSKNKSQWRNVHKMFLSLLKNEEFTANLLQVCCDVRNFYFGKDRADAMIVELRAAYEPYAADTLRRFGPEKIAKKADEWVPKQMTGISTYFTTRYDAFIPIVQNAFGLEPACEVRIVISDPAKGAVYLNERDLPAQDGAVYQYFAECGLTVTAVPAKGAKFVGWTVSHETAEIAAPASDTTQITFRESFTLTANFE